MIMLYLHTFSAFAKKWPKKCFIGTKELLLNNKLSDTFYSTVTVCISIKIFNC